MVTVKFQALGFDPWRGTSKVTFATCNQPLLQSLTETPIFNYFLQVMKFLYEQEPFVDESTLVSFINETSSTEEQFQGRPLNDPSIEELLEYAVLTNLKDTAHDFSYSGMFCANVNNDSVFVFIVITVSSMYLI